MPERRTSADATSADGYLLPSLATLPVPATFADLPTLLTPAVRADRRAALERRAADLGADGLLLSHLPDVRWATGFTGSNALVVVHASPAGGGALVLLTDGRYAAQAAAEAPGVDVRVPGVDLAGALAACGIDGCRIAVQADRLTAAALADLRVRHASTDWSEQTAVLDALVAVKTPAEVARIEAAQRITEAVFDEICEVVTDARARGEALTERDLGARIVYGHLRRGCERMAFDPIVASGPNGALPHARPTDRVLREGDLVVIDMGGVVDGYASDMTRTVAIGEPGDEARRVYGAVLAAHVAAVDAAAPGLYTDALDEVARNVLREAGLGEAFAHGLGHGVGLQTHEWPRVSYARHDVLPDGCVVTIEPGAYLPGHFGVRIEDMVVLCGTGARRLTRTPRALRVL